MPTHTKSHSTLNNSSIQISVSKNVKSPTLNRSEFLVQLKAPSNSSASSNTSADEEDVRAEEIKAKTSKVSQNKMNKTNEGLISYLSKTLFDLIYLMIIS